MRSMRAARATEWVMLEMEYRVMKWHPSPPNPLQHADWKMTLEKYAAKGSDDLKEAYRRCQAKYGDDDATRQPWMEKFD